MTAEQTEVRVGQIWQTQLGSRLLVVWVNKRWVVTVDPKRPNYDLPSVLDIKKFKRFDLLANPEGDHP